jgi:xanthine dehydrogenase accessory factor
MTTHREIVNGLSRIASLAPAVLGAVVRVEGSSYGGVGARVLFLGDGTTVGLVSGGCLESDLAEHARRVRETGCAELVRYDTRDNDDAPWGLGLGCNGLLDVLLEPLTAVSAAPLAELLASALDADTPSVFATVIALREPRANPPAIGAHALFAGEAAQTIGDWGDGAALLGAATHRTDALEAGRRGLVRESAGVEIAFETVTPAVKLVICGSGQDVLPMIKFAVRLDWEVRVVDHRPISSAHARFLPARVVHCADPGDLENAVPLTRRTAAVVMSHHYARDLEYVEALLDARVAYLGVLGPRVRTERMLADLRASDSAHVRELDNLFGPVGLDIGADGPDALALSVIAEISAVLSGRVGGHLRDGRGPLHATIPQQHA